MDLIMQNNSDKRTWIVTGLTNVSTSHIYVQFDDVELPLDMPNGEYSYALITEPAEGVVYEPKIDIWDTIVKWDGKECQLRDLNPSTGLLRIGILKESNTYKEKTENKTFYYKK